MKRIIFLSLLFLTSTFMIEAANVDTMIDHNRAKSIIVEGWLGTFWTIVGTPSESQYYTVTGENLTANIAVSALSGYVYSTDDTNWSTTLSLPASYDGPVYIRLTGAVIGSPSGIISFTSSGATQVDREVEGIVDPPTPQIQVTGWVGSFWTIIGSPSESQYYSVSGANLTANIAVSAVTGYQYSTDNSNWSSSLSLAPSYNGRVYIRLTGLVIGSYSGTISFTSSGATQIDRSVSGTVQPLTPVVNVEGWLSAFSTMVGIPSESQYYTVWGTNLTANIAVSALTGYEYSTDDTNWSSTLSLASSYNGPVYLRLTGAEVGSPGGTISFTSSGATPINRDVSGTVLPFVQTINVTGSFNSFSTIVGSPSSSQYVTLSGTNLTASINVSAVTGYEYSTDNSNWSSSLSLASSYNGRVYARLTGVTIGSQNGTIYFTSTGATQVTRALTGTVNPLTPVITVTGTSNIFTTSTGVPSSSQFYTVSGTNLTAGIVLSAVTGFEYSTTNSPPWTSTLTLDIAFSGNVYVRLNGVTQGSYNGDIAFNSTGAVQKLKHISGYISNSVTITPDPIPGLINRELNNYYATNATGPLEIPAYVQYEGINEIVHPDVVYFPIAWNGYHYWMAYTPFPNGDATYENPCIAVSNDNVTWIVPPGLTNPVDSYASSANDYYSDTELIMDPNQTTMYLLWRRYMNGVYEKLYVKSSTDGINWSAKTEILSVSGLSESLISPAIVYNGAQYLMWTVDEKVTPRGVRLRTANSVYGPWSESLVTNIRPLTYTPPDTPLTETWHINVTKIGNQFWMINNDTAMGDFNGINLYLGISNDGLQWTFASHPILSARNNYLYWDQKLYRASIIPVYDDQQMGFRIWYSVMRKATSVNPPWRIGYTEAWCAPRNTRIQSVVGDNVTIAWDGFASVYQKTTTYKVQYSTAPTVESSWQDATSWTASLTYSFMRNANAQRYFRIKAKVE
jgi:hypothetical protein